MSYGRWREPPAIFARTGCTEVSQRISTEGKSPIVTFVALSAVGIGGTKSHCSPLPLLSCPLTCCCGYYCSRLRCYTYLHSSDPSLFRISVLQIRLGINRTRKIFSRWKKPAKILEKDPKDSPTKNSQPTTCAEVRALARSKRRDIPWQPIWMMI